MTYDQEVVQPTRACCATTRTFDHFCGSGTLLQKKRSRCNECGKDVDAEIWKSNDDPPRIYMRKYCPLHGVTSTRLSSDARFYYVQDEGQACGCAPGSCGPSALGDNALQGQPLHTCTLVVEIVYDCNLECPTCYADSPKRKAGHNLAYLTLNDFKDRVRSVLDKQGRLDIVQLSGGEPTLHPQLFEIVEWLGRNDAVGHVLLNTNGSRLHDASFATGLAAVAPIGKFGIYLQYDGVEAGGQTALRGGDFRAAREHTLAITKEHNLSTALVMTVTHENKFDCHKTLARALADHHIKWMVFQPEFLSGRCNRDKLLETPITVADIVHSVAQGNVMTLDDWMPLPCSDPNCGMVGFLVRSGSGWVGASQYIDLSTFAPLLANRVSFDTDELVTSCGCDDYDLPAVLHSLNIDPTSVKMVFIKPFMDQRTWDAARIASCCTHVLTPDGTVDSFCRYYGR